MPLVNHHSSLDRLWHPVSPLKNVDERCVLVKWREMVSEAYPLSCLFQALAGDLSALYQIGRVLMDKTIII